VYLATLRDIFGESQGMIRSGSKVAAAAGSAALLGLRALAADGEPSVLSAAEWDELADLAAGHQDRSMMSDLVALPCRSPAAIFHLEALRALADEGSHDEFARVRRRYHARCLGLVLLPRDAGLRPLVTVLIPVHDRAGIVVEAIDSCLGQTWRPLEILVIDDGSTDDLRAALLPYGDAIRLHRQEHRGVSSARNLGIRLARGDFIHFLDSDDLLLPDAIQRKVAAFLGVADAELCYSAADAPPRRTLAGKVPKHPAAKPSATHDLIGSVRAGYPFSTSTVMMPRWSMLDAPPFEEDLRRAEDTRYWLSLSLRGTKAIALTAPLTIRRKLDVSLSDLSNQSQEEAVTVRARDLNDMLADPRHWCHAPGFYMRLAADSRHCVPFESATGTAVGALAKLLATLSSIASRVQRDGLSPLPLLAALRADDAVWGQAARRMSLGPDLDRFFASAPGLIARGLRASPPLEPGDIDYWLGARQPHIDKALRMLRFGEPEDRGNRAAFTWILRHVRLPLKRRATKRFRWLRRKTGSSRLAAWLVWGLKRS
jgi:hypothetical protein